LGISTGNAAFKLTHIVLKFINKIIRICEIFCGLAKTFDCVNQKILLTKLYFFGIQETRKLVQAYLTCRKRKIELKSSDSTHYAYSNWVTIKHGVSQG
jgi:hypothetical protein